MVDYFGFTTDAKLSDGMPWIQVKELPSRFKCYPKGAIIEYRPYTFGEVRAFSVGNISQFAVYEAAVDGIRVSNKLAVSDLSYADFQFILLLRKLSTVPDSKWKVSNVFCSACKEEQEVAIDPRSQVEFKDLDVDVPISVELSDKTVLDFDVLRLGHWFEVMKREREGDQRDFFLLLMSSMERKLVFDTVFDKISSLWNPEDIEKIQEVDRNTDHGIKPIEWECTKCKASNSVRLELELKLLLPLSAKNL